MTERDSIHDLLEAAAKHRKAEVYGWSNCVACDQRWPCLVTKLAAEVHHLRKQVRDQTPCVCG
jgi:hypothetical protein